MTQEEHDAQLYEHGRQDAERRQRAYRKQCPDDVEFHKWMHRSAAIAIDLMNDPRNAGERAYYRGYLSRFD